MTPEERAHLVHQLKDSQREYLASIDVNPAQWLWKPLADRWSVGQTAAHIVQAEAVIFQRMQVAIQSPVNPDWQTKTSGKVELLRRVMLDRTQKATAPETTRPRELPKEEVLLRFQELREQIIRFAEQTEIPLEKHTAEHPFPVFNTLSAYQWLVLVPLHQMRHCQQIAEVKATPGYPA